jgi:hypothetical protein
MLLVIGLLAAGTRLTSLSSTARPFRRLAVPARAHVHLATADADADLRAEIARLRNETDALRTEVKQIEEVNELAKPRKVPPPSPPPLAPRADSEAPAEEESPEAVSIFKLPFGLRVEAQVQQKEASKGPEEEEDPLFRFDMETTRLPLLGRLVSTLPYIVPLLDGASFAPPTDPWLPLLFAARLYYSIPFSTLAFFILLSVLSQNYEIPFPVRYNMRQAIILDIAISIPTLIGSLLGFLTNSALGLPEEVQQLLFYVSLVTVLYCQVCNLLGILPKGIPYISEAADSQSGPRW